MISAMARFRVFFHPAPSPADGTSPPAVELPDEPDLFLPWLRRRLGLGERRGPIIFSGVPMADYPRDDQPRAERRTVVATPPSRQLAEPRVSSVPSIPMIEEPLFEEPDSGRPSPLPDNSWLDEDWSEQR